MPKTVGLTAKQERFVAEYLVDGNATRAAKAAGFKDSGAMRYASDLLRVPAVKAAIDAGSKRIAAKLQLTAEKVLTDIARVADKAEAAKEFSAALKGYEMLGKHLRLFTDKVELTGANDGPVEFTEIRRTIVRPPKP